MKFSEEKNFYRNIIKICTFNNLERIYNESLDLLTRLEGVDLAAIYIQDSTTGDLILEAQKNIPEDFLKDAEVLPSGKGITWDLVQKPRVLIMDDMQQQDGIADVARRAGIRSAVGFPVMFEGTCRGVIWTLSYSAGAFGDEVSEMISTASDLLASSISGIKRREELKSKNFQLEIFSQLSVFFNEVDDLDPTLEMLRHLLKQIHIIDGKAIYLVEQREDRRVAVLRAEAGIPREIKSKFSTINYPNGITWECIEKGEIVYYPFREIEKYEYFPLLKESGIKSLISVPIKIRQNSVGACNFVSFSRNYFNKEELDFIKTFGSLVGSALARLEAEKKLTESSVTDNLSGLYNSRYFHEFLKKELARAKRNQNSLSLLVIDMDGFKQINDNYGHLAGDHVISEVGKSIKNNVRVMDVAARYGGDEFALILPETGYHMSKNMAARLYNKLASMSITIKNGNCINPRLSIGISTLSFAGETADELIRMADEAMYQNKRENKHQFLHSKDMTR